MSPGNYRLDEFMDDVHKGIWSELNSGGTIDVYRRNLQKVYVDELGKLLTLDKAFVTAIPVGVTYGFNRKMVNLNQTDVPSLARHFLETLNTDVKRRIGSTRELMTKAHLQDISKRIERYLDPK
jgi:hypothetical protein